MQIIDRTYTARPFYGYRRMACVLRREGHDVNRKRIQRLMGLMGLQAVYPKPRTTLAAPGHRIFPYLLRTLRVERPDQVWATDITYIPMRQGFLYLVAVLDWFSRCVLSWELSNTMDIGFCLVALEKALSKGTPEIFNSDQGAQFHQRRFHAPSPTRQHQSQHGWTGPSARQRICRAALAQRKTRGNIFERICRRCSRIPKARTIF